MRIMNSLQLCKRLVVLIAVICTLNACKKNGVDNIGDTQEPRGSEYAYSGSETILGKKMENPYTVDNIRRAVLALKKTSSGSRANEALAASITATHKYLRFKPATTEDVITLENLGYEISDLPFDSEIEYLGDWYQDPSIPADQPTYLYTVLPIDEPLPSGIMVTKLADLYLFTEDNTDTYDGDTQDKDPWEPEPDPWEKRPTLCWDPNIGYYDCGLGYRKAPKNNAIRKATENLKQIGVNPRNLYNEAMRITGNDDEVLTDETATNARKFKPAGLVTVLDNSTGIGIPLRGITVKTRRWFNLVNTTTDANGRFYVNRSYRKKATVLVKLKNGAAKVRDINGALKVWQYIFPMKKNIGLYSSSDMENILYTFAYSTNPKDYNTMCWVGATAMNAVWDMYQYCQADGIPVPPANLNVWVSSAITQNASTPMLRYIANTSTVSKGIDFMLAASGFPQVAGIKRVIQGALPDITCNYTGGNGLTQSSVDLNNTFLHELSHSVHYSQVGNGYWEDYIGYILGNSGYGAKTTSGSGRIAVAEGWAFYLGNTYAARKYNNLNRPNTGQPFITQLEYERPIDNVDVLFSSSSSQGWIPFGMFHDMTDVGEPVETGVVDNVSGYTIRQLYSGMQSNVSSVPAYRTEFLNRNGNAQAVQVNQLVSSYRY